MRFVILPNITKDENFQVTHRILNILADLQQEAYLLEDDATYMGIECDTITLPEVATVDMVIVIGGDGTILNAARRVVTYNKPLLGINLGRLGFLAEVEKEDLKGAFKRIINGEYEIDRRMMLKVVYNHEGEEESFLALNDAVVTRGAFSRMLDLHVHINDRYMDTFTADGVIVASPTGSTAYNLSAGGPILNPSNEMMVITPICPHSLYIRSIVLSSHDEIRIVIGTESDDGDMMLTIDGQNGFKVCYKDEVIITKSDYETLLVRTSQNSFYDILREKMLR